MSYKFIQSANANPRELTFGPVDANKPAWAAWLGEPSSGYNTISPYDATDKSLRGLGEGVRGLSENLGNTMTVLAFANNSPVTSIIFPIQLTDQLQVNYSQWDFNPHLPDQVPENGIVRIVSSHRTMHREALIRFGIGLQIDWEFAETPLGQQHYKLSLVQINMAFNEGLNYQGLEAIVMNGDVFRRVADMNAIQVNTNFFRDVMERELHFWAIFQRETFPMAGFVAGLNDINHDFNASTQLTTFVVSKKILTYLKLIPLERKMYSISGKIPIETDPFKSDSGTYRDESGNNFIVLRNYAPNGHGAIDPFEQQAQIGEYFVSVDPMANTDYTNYSSKKRAIEVYSQYKDGWVEIDLKTMIAGCMRFDPDTGELVPPIYANLNTTRGGTKAFNVEDIVVDMFYYLDTENNIQTVDRWGDVNSIHLPVTAYQSHARSMLAKMSRDGNNRMEMHDDFENAHSLVEEIIRVRYDQNLDDFIKFSAGVAANAPAPKLNDYDGVGAIWEPNAYGGFDLPLLRDITAINPTAGNLMTWRGTMVLPPTHLSYEGWKTIAAQYNKLQNAFFDQTGFPNQSGLVVSNFMKTFTKIVRYIQMIMPGSLDPVTGIHDLFNVFIESIIGHPLPPLFIAPYKMNQGNTPNNVGNTTLTTTDIIAWDRALEELEEFITIRSIKAAYPGLFMADDTRVRQGNFDINDISNPENITARYGENADNYRIVTQVNPAGYLSYNAANIDNPQSADFAKIWLLAVLRPEISNNTFDSPEAFKNHIIGTGLRALIMLTVHSVQPSVFVPSTAVPYANSDAKKLVDAVKQALGEMHQDGSRTIDVAYTTSSQPLTVFARSMLDFFANNPLLLSTRTLRQTYEEQNRKTMSLVDRSEIIRNHIRHFTTPQQKNALFLSDYYVRTNLVFTSTMLETLEDYLGSQGNLGPNLYRLPFASSVSNPIPPDLGSEHIINRPNIPSRGVKERRPAYVPPVLPKSALELQIDAMNAQHAMDLQQMRDEQRINTLAQEVRIAETRAADLQRMLTLLTQEQAQQEAQVQAQGGQAQEGQALNITQRTAIINQTQDELNAVKGVVAKKKTDLSDAQALAAQNKVEQERKKQEIINQAEDEGTPLNLEPGSFGDIDYSETSIFEPAGSKTKTRKPGTGTRTSPSFKSTTASYLKTSKKAFPSTNIPLSGSGSGSGTDYESGSGSGSGTDYESGSDSGSAFDESSDSSSSTSSAVENKIGWSFGGRLLDFSGVNRYLEEYSRQKASQPSTKSMYFSTQKVSKKDPESVRKPIGSTNNYVMNMEQVKDSKLPPLIHMLCVAFMNTPVTMRNMMAFVDYDVMVPVNVLLLRPHMRYRTMMASYLLPGRETGLTMLAKVRVVLGDDTIVGFHHMRLTYYSRTIVLQPKNIINIRNCLVTGHLGGAGHQIYRDVNAYNPVTGNWGHGEDSIFSLLTAWNEVEYPTIYLPGRQPNIRGYSGDIISDPLQARLKDLSCSSIVFYSNLWGWNAMLKDVGNMEVARGGVGGSNYQIMTGNSICFRGQCKRRDASGEWAWVMPNGHWTAELTYSGCDAARSGLVPRNPKMMLK